MSIEHLKEYARRCATEPELLARAKTIGFADPEAHIEHGESLGLQFDMDDALAFHNEMVGADEEMAELGEEDLEKIAGGAVFVVSSSLVAAAAVAGVGAGVAVGVGVGGAAGAAAGAIASAGGSGW